MSEELEFLGTERFLIESRLGSGGMGVVYQAFDRQLNTQIALKTLRQPNPEALFLFKNEFRALADLFHPNLVRLYELIHEKNLWFFTMELLRGEDFLSFVRPIKER